MRRKIAEAREDQRGEVMLESAIIMVAVLILLFVLLGLSFMLYQQSLLNTVASEIAADLGKNYKFSTLPVGSTAISIDDVKKAPKYRTLNGILYDKSQKHDDDIHRADVYADWRINLSSLGFDDDEIQISYFSWQPTGVGRMCIQIEVSQETDFFLSGILDFAGITDEHTLFSASAYAEVSDLSAYTSMVNFTEYASGKLSLFDSIGGFYDSLKGLIEKLIE